MRSLRSIAALIPFLAVLSACEERQGVLQPEESGNYEFSIKASCPEITRSDYDAAGTFSWSEGDAISVLFHKGGENRFFTLSTSGSGPVATFTGTIGAGYSIGSGDDGTKWAFFPAGSHTYASASEISFNIPAVTDYTAERRYGIRSKKPLQDWIKQYNTHGEIRCRGSGGGSYMRKARNTTPEERLEIVRYCLANDKNYGAAALKYNCSYQQVRNWVLRYEKMGSAGLEDRRGRRAGTQPARTPEEELRDKIAELERRNRDLQMENDLLKKVRELEMKDRYL